MRTLIYHITYYDYDKSVYIQFAGCNLRCLGCIRNRYGWDHHLEDTVMENLTTLKQVNTLTIEELRNILTNTKAMLGLKKAVLGGGEPTHDPSFCEVMEVLKSLDLDISILTNGYIIDKVLRCIPTNTVIELSIKSIYPDKYRFYTGGGDLYRVLKNFEIIIDGERRVLVETILIPDFNEAKDIEKLAIHVASYNREIPMIIDEYIPIPTAPWRRPTEAELETAYKLASKHLKHVTVRSSYEKFGTSKKLGNVISLYPELLRYETSNIN
ncbi:radical SAM protein [Ignisphaera sp. 4213-co]|uniref:Radical SAM protein n=1 Tax=Ignisphaera cupida TaxID=3050454 RepID=A0ABD4Z4W5_9CREN|nr:radical SAM protein [Ignisphaera sp. 4213-co]MDK6028357.1 radical SAM protein [Ignisphaera sp. 4213-co]